MNFSKTTEYALRILSFMAMDETRLYTANDIFENLQIPFRYLRKQLTLLTKNALLISVQGKDGGYKIARKLSEISLMDIVTATGDNINSNQCFFGFEDCTFDNNCAMHDKWANVRKNIKEVLISTTLSEVKATGPHSFISNK